MFLLANVILCVSLETCKGDSSRNVVPSFTSSPVTFVERELRQARLMKRNASPATLTPARRSHLQRIINGMYITYCSCIGGYIRDSHIGCIIGNSTITVVDGSPHSPMDIDTQLTTGILQDLQCPAHKASLILPEGSFVLLPGGNIFVVSLGMYLTHDHYCTDHLKPPDSNVNTTVEWTAKVCLKDTIKRCNDSNSAYEGESRDNGSSASQKYVSAKLGNVSVSWDYMKLPTMSMSCSSRFSLTKQTLNDKNILTYSREGASFVRNVRDELYRSYRHDQFCVTHNNEGAHEVLFCTKNTFHTRRRVKLNAPESVRKCCKPTQVYNMERHACENSLIKNNWIAKLYRNIHTMNSIISKDRTDINTSIINGTESERNVSNDATIDDIDEWRYGEEVWGFPQCSWQNIGVEERNLRFHQDALQLLSDDAEQSLTSFCFDTFLLPSSNVS